MFSWTDPPRRSEAVTISGGNHTFLLAVTMLHNNTASGGTVVARLVGDSIDSTYYIPAGGFQPGCFTVVTQSGTSLATVLGLSPQGL